MKKETEKKITLMSGASMAISYKKANPKADTEEAISHVMRSMSNRGEEKIFAIAGANFVLKILERSPQASEKELMQTLANASSSVLMSIEEQILE